MSQQDNQRQVQVNDPVGASFSSIFFCCISIIIIFAIISNIVKYFMAATAMSRGDVGSAALIMSEGSYRQPVYNPRPVYSSTPLTIKF